MTNQKPAASPSGVLCAKHLPLSLLLFSVGACTRLGYAIHIKVTAPVSVQQAFSASQPGLWADHNYILGRFCAPSSDDVTFNIEISDAYSQCADKKDIDDSEYGHADVFPANTQRFDSATSKLLACGDTGAVLEPDNSFVQATDTIEPSTLVATGRSVGACGADGNYYVEISLSR